MGCIEIKNYRVRYSVCAEINRNMGCIEIYLAYLIKGNAPRLIETWDVLKSLRHGYIRVRIKINRNMGCIEIRLSVVRFLLCR